MCVSFDFLETSSDLSDSDNCPPVSSAWLVFFNELCVCMCVHRERSRAAGHRQTPRCCPLNYTLSGCVLVAGPYRSSPDGSHPQGDGERMEDGWREGGRRVLLWSFEEERWALRGLDNCLFPLPFFSACFCFFLFHFLSLFRL